MNATTNTVTVYAKASTSSEAEGVGNGDAGFVRPKVGFTAAGIDNTMTVAFSIPKGSSNADISVSLTGTTKKEFTLGYTNEVYSSWSVYTYSVRGYFGHGDQTIETVTITTSDGIVVQVKLDKPIIIKNPSSVNKTS
jgi:hypothetical protein